MGSRLSRVDVLVAAAFLVIGELTVVLGEEGTAPRAVAVVLTAAYAVPLAWRRHAPLVVVCVVAGAILVLGVVDDQSQPTLPVAFLLALYSAGRYTPRPWTFAAVPVGVGSMWGAMLILGEATVTDVLFVALFFGGAWGVGRVVRVRGAQTAAAEARAERAETDRDAAERAAVESERARIARELHDVVSHSISVVAVQAQAVRRRLPEDQEREADDLRLIERTARDAMAEMRRLFGVLRADGDPASLAPQPGLQQLGRLLADVRASGLAVELVEEGGRPVLSPGLDLAVFRVVQEALTNARRHAQARAVRVTLRFTDGGVEIDVVDDGRGPGPGDEPGHGLLGMRERVALYGGTLETGAAPGGGFRVRATLPIAVAG